MKTFFTIIASLALLVQVGCDNQRAVSIKSGNIDRVACSLDGYQQRTFCTVKLVGDERYYSLRLNGIAPEMLLAKSGDSVELEIIDRKDGNMFIGVGVNFTPPKKP